MFICVVFMLPFGYAGVPWNKGFDWNLFNYTPFPSRSRSCSSAAGTSLSARKWFKGPIRQGDEAELARIESEFGEGSRRAAPAPRVSELQPLSRSPAGSKSGSAATSPATHSPKISTSTGWPGSARSAGHVGVRDRALDRVAVAAARHPADELAVDPHRLGAERDRARVVEDEAGEPPLRLAARRAARRGR